jgi:thiaminase
MQQKKKRPGHHYSVYVSLYASEEVKRLVERNEEDFTTPSHFAARVFYSDRSQAQAERAFTRACLFAMNNPLAFEVVMQRDDQTLIRIKAEQF